MNSDKPRFNVLFFILNQRKFIQILYGEISCMFSESLIENRIYDSGLHSKGLNSR